jgi:hypothetical protein
MHTNVHQVLYEGVVAYILYSVCLRVWEDRTCFFKRLSVLFPLLIYLMMKVAHVNIHLEWVWERKWRTKKKKNFFFLLLIIIIVDDWTYVIITIVIDKVQKLYHKCIYTQGSSINVIWVSFNIWIRLAWQSRVLE